MSSDVARCKRRRLERIVEIDRQLSIEVAESVSVKALLSFHPPLLIQSIQCEQFVSESDELLQFHAFGFENT